MKAMVWHDVGDIRLDEVVGPGVRNLLPGQRVVITTHVDRREEGWIKTILDPSSAEADSIVHQEAR